MTDLYAAQIRAADSDQCRITLPGGYVRLTEPWEFHSRSVVLESAGAWTTIVAAFDKPQPVAISTIGTEHLHFSNLEIASGHKYPPQVLWLAGRKPRTLNQTYARSVGGWRIDNVRLTGPALVASAYWIGIERETVTGCGFSNSLVPTTNCPAWGLYLSDSDDYGVPGNYEHDGAYNTSAVHCFINCDLGQYAIPPFAAPVHALGIGNRVHDLRWIGGSASSNSQMTAIVNIVGQGNYNLFFDAPDWEARSSRACIQLTGKALNLELIRGLAQAKECVLRVTHTGFGTGQIAPATRMAPASVIIDAPGQWN